ncbi:MAG: hypothetical protein LBE55_02885 [Clostridiales bacterium]|jgi:hypothetical protein|nr:hypothetical protein [Clostridiales bacterium]
MRIYEQNPAAIIALCPKMSLQKDAPHAAQPFSACLGCPHHSFMSCNMPGGAASAAFFDNSGRAFGQRNS